MAKLLTKSIKSSLTAIDRDLKNIEVKIIDAINEDDNLKSLYKLITSVVGIGFVTAINLKVHTNGFTMLKDTRKGHLKKYLFHKSFYYIHQTTTAIFLLLLLRPTGKAFYNIH